ncbi:MAG: phage Gp37/Gp68 family protein [Bryobacterales bacterium]|nr:phage Gp37/Gp68 family protein [Bryobacterales bacterium]
MASNSGIEWTETTWNPVTGCSKVSDGCKHCYAERMSRRLQAMGLDKYGRGFQVAQHPGTLEAPCGWASPRLVFVNSMSDLFHEAVEPRFIQSVFRVMNSCPRHTFQVLTKRPQRALALDRSLNWTRNIWLGVSIESRRWSARARTLRMTSAQTKFLSLEPLLGPLPGLDLSGIDWVIAGGESGPGARPVHRDWIREIRDACVRHEVPFFFKQWGGVNKKHAGRLLDGTTWDEMPAR